MNCGEERADKVLVEIPVLTHFINTLPFQVSHLFLDHLCCQIFTRQVTTSKLDTDNNHNATQSLNKSDNMEDRKGGIGLLLAG